MNSNYDRAFKLVIGHEGGFQNDPRDRGNWTTGVIGKGTNKGTKYGITAMSYPSLDIRNLTLDQAKAIYKRDFWDKVRGDDLPVGVDFLVFDAAVNHGTGTSARFLQRASGAVADGAIGPKTLAAVRSKDPEDVAFEFNVERSLFYAGLSTFRTYGRGWTRRLLRTLLQAHDMMAPLDQSKADINVDPRQLSLFGKE